VTTDGFDSPPDRLRPIIEPGRNSGLAPGAEIMGEEKKSTRHDGGVRDCAAGLRAFARALVGPGPSQAAESLAETALANISLMERPDNGARELAFAETIRLNRRRLRERAPIANAGRAGAGTSEAERRDGGLAAQIAAMPLDEREILLIVSLAQFSYEAAARILDLPRSSVISRLMRARARIDADRIGVASIGAAGRAGHLRLIK
jgi:DNA-directed RNA polymerase specialized sigma24 family protein